MNKNVELQYDKIVKSAYSAPYLTPEEQGRKIQRCSILKSIEIEYSTTNRIGKLQL